jgi:hypothetical protein
LISVRFFCLSFCIHTVRVACTARYFDSALADHPGAGFPSSAFPPFNQLLNQPFCLHSWRSRKASRAGRWPLICSTQT